MRSPATSRRGRGTEEDRGGEVPRPVTPDVSLCRFHHVCVETQGVCSRPVFQTRGLPVTDIGK